MKAVKITLLMLAVMLLTVSGVQPKDNGTEQPTYKEYSPKDLVATDKKKIKMGGIG